MSNLKVTNINNASASSGGLSIDTSGAVTGSAPWGGRNLLYNGGMQVAQRGTSTASITAAGYYTADRWSTVGPSTAGTWTQSVENDAPTGSGFRKSLKMLCTTANSSLSAGSYMFVAQNLEGQDVQRIAKGTASAQQLTLSFWVKANVTGTYVIELADVDNSRIACASYTVSASATWERKTITFPADTTGAFDNDNALSLQVIWWLVAGTNFTSGALQTTWAANTNANRAVGQTNLAAATNNYWQVTGVQLEVGPTATGFEFKSFGQELRECQRYYIHYGGQQVNELIGFGLAESTTEFVCTTYFPQTMRTSPSSIRHSGLELVLPGTSDYSVSAVTLATTQSGDKVGCVNATSSGLTHNRTYWLRANNSTAAYLGFSAEL